MNTTPKLPYLLLLCFLWNQTLILATENNPSCLTDLTFILDDTAKEVTVWANDLLQETADIGALELRLWHPSLVATRPEGGGAAKTILELPSSINFDCGDIGIQLIEVYTIDTAGNWAFCLSNIDILDTNKPCSTTEEASITERIAGHIVTTTNTPIENVTLKLISDDAGKGLIHTDTAGYFEMKMPEDKDFIVKLEREGNILNGVSTFDIVLIAKHIINAAPFTAPFQYIAADVNRSGTVTAFDMVELRRAILGIQTERFPNNTSWRFITKEDYYAASNPLEQDFTESILLTDLDNPIGNLSFFAVKIGDVNDSADINGLLSAESRTVEEALKITTTDKVVRRGETFSLVLTTKYLKELQSLQFSLFCKDLKILAIEEGILKAHHFAVLDRNSVGVSWDAITAIPVQEKEEILFKLQIEALQNGQLSQLLTFSEEISPEVVNQKEELLDLKLNFLEHSPFELFQNEPNPFDKETSIGFTLPESGLVTVEIFSLNGQLLKQIQRNFNQGYNEVIIDKQTLTQNGTLLYQVSTEQGILTKKMIALKE